MGPLTQVCRLQGHEERIWSVAWRPQAQPPQLASCGSDRTIRVWAQRASARPEAEDAWVLRAEIDASSRHSRSLRSVSWSPSGDLMVISSFDATASLWQEAKPSQGAQELEGQGRVFECVGAVSGHENEVKAAAFSPSGDYLATCSRDKSVWIYETDAKFEYECLAVLQSHSQDVKSVRWHPSQDVLFSCSYDDSIKIWGPDGDDWVCRQTLTGHESTVWALSFDAVGSRFVSCSEDGSLRLWCWQPASTSTRNAPASEPASASASATSATSQGGQGRHLAAAAFVGPLFRGGALAAAAAATPSAGAGAAAGQLPQIEAPPDAAACEWRTEATLGDQHPRPVYSVDWLHIPGPAELAGVGAGGCVASACGDNHVRVFRPQGSQGQNRACLAEIEAHAGDVNCVMWHPGLLEDGSALLASVGDDAEVAIWQFKV